MKRVVFAFSIVMLSFFVMCLVACAPASDGASREAVGSAAQSNIQSGGEEAVMSVQQLDVRIIRHEYAEVGAETGHGGYGEYTEIALDADGYDAMKDVLAQRNERVADEVTRQVSAHANDAGATTVTESGLLDALLGGTETSTDAVEFINFLTSSTVTRADSQLLCVLDTTIDDLSGWGHKMSFETHVYDPQTGFELSIEDLVADTSQLPELLDAALHKKYLMDDMFKEGENAAQVVRNKLENPDEHGRLAWTADYLGMRFYFDSSDFDNADAYHGMYVSLPYAEHPDLFDARCAALPESYIAQLEYDTVYELADDAAGRSICVSRLHEDGAEAQKGWTFATRLGAKAGDGFSVSGEATSSPWFYDVYRQDYAPCLVCVEGSYYLYGFGDRNSDDYKTTVYDLRGDEPVLVDELSEGFSRAFYYASWAFPSNPVAATMADRDCLASYDRILFERDCTIDKETGLPAPAGETYRAHTRNEAYRALVGLNGMLLDEEGNEVGQELLPEGAVCVLEAGKAYDHYDMRIDDGRLIRLYYDKQTHEIDEHYTADVLVMVPAATAAETGVELGARQRTVWHHGGYVSLVPETGNVTGTGAIIDYGDTPWWVVEDFVGTFEVAEQDRVEAAENLGPVANVKSASLEIREDGTFSFVADGTVYEGTLDDTRGWGVYAGGVMGAVDGGYSQEVSLDYLDGESEETGWSRIEFMARDLPYPMSQYVVPYHCYLTRVG